MPSSSPLLSLQCPDSTVSYGAWTIHSPSLIPTCILAALIGFIGSYKIRKSKLKGYDTYAVSFFFFGCMMTDAMFVHCFESTVILDLIDVGLTSSIALSFLFNGLVDLNWINERKPITKLVMVLSYCVIFLAWYFSLTKNWSNAFFYLYFCVIVVSCGVYLLAETIHLLKSKGQGLELLLLGGIFGAVGLAAAYFNGFNLWLCGKFGRFIDGEFVWFICSDLAMFSLLFYYLDSRSESIPVAKKSERIPLKDMV